MIDRLIYYISIFLALMVVLTVHEFSHAFVAVKCGDNTPKLYNRYTLNPFNHFDVLGLLCLLFAHFGWAKPVPINPNNFKHYKLDSVLVSIAGVLSNYILAFLIVPIIYLVSLIPSFFYFTTVLDYAVYFIFSMSLSFAVFNFLPLYPLDGFRVVEALDKKKSKAFYTYKRVSYYILLALIVLGILADVLEFSQIDILGNYIGFIVRYIEIPILKFWGLIF